MKLRMKGTTYKVAVNGAHLRQKADHLYNKCIYIINMNFMWQ